MRHVLSLAAAALMLLTSVTSIAETPPPGGEPPSAPVAGDTPEGLPRTGPDTAVDGHALPMESPPPADPDAADADASSPEPASVDRAARPPSSAAESPAAPPEAQQPLGSPDTAGGPKIVVRKEGGARRYYYDGRLLRTREELSGVFKLSGDQEAQRAYRASATLRFAALFGAAVGGALMGTAVGSALGGEGWTKDNEILLGIGAGVVVVSIPLAVGSDRKREAAVRLFNAHASGRTDGTPEEQ